MPNIVTRAGKTSTLTHNELDANFARTATQKTTTYAILASDNRSLIEGSHATTPFTITLPTLAAAAGEDTGDFEVTVSNINAAVVSVDGNGSETIDGSTSVITLKQWDSVTIKLDASGTGWKTISRVGDLGAIDATTGSFSGAVTASGGVDGVLGGVTPAAVAATTGTFSGAVSATTGTFSGAVSVDDTTQSTSTTTGSLHTDGGLGVAKNTFLGGNIDIQGTIDATGVVTLTRTTNATSSTTGAVISAGGVGIAKDLYVGDDLFVIADADIGGDLGVTGDITYDSIVQPKVKIITISDWNMDVGASETVAHGLTFSTIRSCQVLIYNDANDALYPIDYSEGGDPAGSFSIDSSNVTLTRDLGGFFDDGDFDAATGTRGFITIEYV